MPKSIYTSRYSLLLKLLRAARVEAGLTQEDVASRLGTTQTVVSKCERGERRLDVIELQAWCAALGLSLVEFVKAFEREL